MNGIIFELDPNKKNMKILILVSLALFSIGCRTQKDMIEKQQTNSNIQLVAVIGETNLPTDMVNVTNVKVVGNKMLIDISYSGGCAEHEFKLNGSPMIAKSLPPIRAIQLIHNANGDKCKKMIMQTLEVDIKALAYNQEVGSKILLTMNGWKDRIEYIFE